MVSPAKVSPGKQVDDMKRTLRDAANAWRSRWATWRRERRLRYLGLWQMGREWVRNRHLTYRFLTDGEVRARRRSETIFLIGSGPSVSRLTEHEWRRVREADSCGMNYSFFLPHIPTFHILEDPKSREGRALFARQFAPKRTAYTGTVWGMHRKQLKRLIHPRFAPEFFPETPQVWAYRQPPTIEFERDRSFVAEDFERAIIYRGTMSVALWFAVRLGYRRVVMLGVDLHTHEHFYDAIPEMRPHVIALERVVADLRARGGGADVGYPARLTPEKPRPFDEYFYALNELYCRPRGIELYVGNDDNMLCPKIPCFEDW